MIRFDSLASFENVMRWKAGLRKRFVATHEILSLYRTLELHWKKHLYSLVFFIIGGHRGNRRERWGKGESGSHAEEVWCKNHCWIIVCHADVWHNIDFNLPIKVTGIECRAYLSFSSCMTECTNSSFSSLHAIFLLRLLSCTKNFVTDLTAMGVRVNEVNSEAEKMVRGGHSQARKIKARQQQLNNKWGGSEEGGLHSRPFVRRIMMQRVKRSSSP